MAYASEWLMEIDAHDGTDVQTLRYSTSGYVTGPNDDPANTIYDGRIASLGVFSRHLYGDGRTMGSVTVDLADATLSNADKALDDLIDLGVDGRRFTLKRLAHPRAAYSTAETVLTGTLEGIDASDGMLTLRVRFYDRRRDIDIPIQKNKYGGTTTTAGATADGPPDMKGQLKPLLYGTCFSVPAIIVNPHNLILQFHDGVLASIALYDGGVPLINDGDVADLAALVAATGNPGHYKTCLALGLARPFGANNGRPGYTWTADVVEGATAADRRAGALVQRMLAKIDITGSSNIDAASFAALDTLQPAELGIYIDNETTALAACHEILRSIGAYIIPNEFGQFTVGRLDEPGTPIATLSEPQILTASKDETLAFTVNPDTDGGVPTHRIDVNFAKNWHVHTDSDLGGCVNHADPNRASNLKLEWREVSSEDPDVLTKHKLSKEISLDTLFVEEAAAQSEADRTLGLQGVHRHVVRVACEREGADLMVPNATIALKLDRFGYSDGKPMVIIGRADDWQAEKTILTLWG